MQAVGSGVCAASLERQSTPDVSCNNLADAYESAGRLEQAIDLFEQTLSDRLRVLGPDHPGTLASRNNLNSQGSI